MDERTPKWEWLRDIAEEFSRLARGRENEIRDRCRALLARDAEACKNGFPLLPCPLPPLVAKSVPDEIKAGAFTVHEKHPVLKKALPEKPRSSEDDKQTRRLCVVVGAVNTVVEQVSNYTAELAGLVKIEVPRASAPMEGIAWRAAFCPIDWPPSDAETRNIQSAFEHVRELLKQPGTTAPCWPALDEVPAERRKNAADELAWWCENAPNKDELRLFRVVVIGKVMNEMKRRKDHSDIAPSAYSKPLQAALRVAEAKDSYKSLEQTARDVRKGTAKRVVEWVQAFREREVALSIRAEELACDFLTSLR